MGFWNALWKTETTDWVYGLLGEQQVAQQYGKQWVVTKDQAYVSATMRRMRIPYSRMGWNAYSGAVHCFAELGYNGDPGRLKLRSLATPLELEDLAGKKVARIETRDRRLFGPVPYRGGDFSFELGLFSIRDDLAAPYIALLGKLAPLLGIPYLTTAAGLVETVKAGIDGLSAQASLEVGVTNTFSEVRSGCYVLAAMPATPGVLAELTVDADHRLYRQGVLVTEPYVIFSIDVTANRMDYLEIADVGSAYRAVSEELRATPRDQERLGGKLKAFRTAAALSPDLLRSDAERIYIELEQLASSLEGLVGDATPSDPGKPVSTSTVLEPTWPKAAIEEGLEGTGASTNPYPCSAVEAVQRANSLVDKGGQYVYGTGDYVGDDKPPWTTRGGLTGADCAGFAISWCYKLRRHRPGYNRGSWATVSDDINCNSILEDAAHAQELFTFVADDDRPRPGDLIAYPTVRHDGRSFIGHVGIVIGCDRAPNFRLDKPDWSLLDIAQCCGKNERKPAVIMTSGAHWNLQDRTGRADQRTRLLRAVPLALEAVEMVTESDRLKRKLIANMVKLDRIASVEESLEASNDTGPLDDEWLRQIIAAQAELATKGEAAMEQYRNFYDKQDMTVEDAEALLDEMKRAIGTPERYFDEVKTPPVEEGLGSAVRFVGNVFKTGLSLPDPITADQQSGLDALREDYNLGNDVAIDPNDHTFELCDPGWWHLLKADKWDRRHWPEGLAMYISDSPARTFIYDDQRNSTSFALMADFGVGQYHSHYIARQLEQRAYPYVFHLGDVYYGGTPDEFATHYSAPLDRLMNKSLLFSMPENHELYSGGFAYQAFLKNERARGRIIQDGSYFCVRFPEHQVVAIDANWNGRQRFTHEPSRHWLREVLRTGQHLTTILLTGSAPYRYGKTSTTQLFEDLKEWHSLGLFHAWFWGDDHYCALFERDDTFKFVGSCIGHAGFPGDQVDKNRPSAAKVTWVEDAARFPKGYHLPDNLTNPGWVELTMLKGGGVELVYYDWLSQKRLDVTYRAEGDGVKRKLVLRPPAIEFPRRVGPFR